MTMKKNEMRLHLKSAITEIQLSLMADDSAAVRMHLSAAAAGIHRVQTALMPASDGEKPSALSLVQKPAK